MTDPIVIHAVEDESVNFVTHLGDGEAFEARYVRRTEDYFIAYVSSQAGCDRACRFCHLTATGQTSMRQASVDDYVGQISQVLDHHRTQSIQPSRININFMARGEPLLNPVLQNRDLWLELRQRVQTLCQAIGIDDIRYNISTILPVDALRAPLETIFADGGTTLYYSLYSMRPEFRRRWLPKAADPVAALTHLARWQRATGLTAALHWAFIEGENDDVDTIEEIIDAVLDSGLSPKFNCVRFNSPNPKHREPSEAVIERNFDLLQGAFNHPESRIVPRVGFSAKASCGMFVDSR